MLSARWSWVCGPPLAISELCPHEPRPLVDYWRYFSIVRYAALVRYSEFGGCSLFGNNKCIVSMGIAVGTSTVVRYWECPLSEVPLYIIQEQTMYSGTS